MATDWHAAVDIGGTFTDVLAVDRSTGTVAISKLLTTHRDPAIAVRDGVEAVLGQVGIATSSLGPMVHATTLVTNAVIEKKGARTALLITEGFRDTLLIGREHRYDMYDLLLEKPEPLVPRRDTLPVPERVLADGTIHRPLDVDAVSGIADELRRRQIRAVGVCFLHSYRYPYHEQRTREILLERCPELNVTLSNEVVGELREYERASTTVTNAYVLALIDKYLQRLEQDLDDMGHHGELFVMLSSGALATPETARAFPVRLIESGPAAGAIAAAQSGLRMGKTDLLSFDMGGTTAKACIVEKGRPTIARELEVARRHRFIRGSGIPLQVSSVELIEIGAGGGSLARIDSMGLMQVGPDSAGADPGPVCYGRSGTSPAVTDADLLLGYLDPNFFLGGRMKLDLAAAKRSVQEHLALPLDVALAEAAWMVHEVVNENMANAARVHAVERGSDVQGLPLFAFGGAGPVHAYRVAKNLGIDVVIAPLGAGIGSAIGLLAAPLAFDFVRTAVFPLPDIDWIRVDPLLASMEGDGKLLLERAGLTLDMIAVEFSIDMRLAGQAHEITVEIPGGRLERGDEGILAAAYERTYSELFGRKPPAVAIEVVNWRIRVVGPRPVFPITSTASPKQDTGSSTGVKGKRRAYFPETHGFTETPVYDRYALVPGMTFTGPALFEERESTAVLGPGAKAHIDEHRNLVMELPK